jgi:DNA-binding response OmpR family regulator
MVPDPDRLKILVVDDDNVIAETLGIILRKAGFEVRVCHDGSEAIAAARAFQPDIVLSDYEMPEMNGVDACVQIKSMLPGCRIIMLSGHSLHERLESFQPPRHDFLLLSKPIYPVELLDLLSSEQMQPRSDSESQIKVLNVDDVEEHRYSLTRLFTHAGFDVSEASTGNDALRSAIESKPDMILLDIHLPDVDGYDVCAALKRNPETAMITIIHVTSLAKGSESALRSAESGADDYIAYPVVPSTLVKRARELLQRRYLSDHPE